MLDIDRHASAVHVPSPLTALCRELVEKRRPRALQCFGYPVQLNVQRSVFANCLDR
jgi:hypothetical protein